MKVHVKEFLLDKRILVIIVSMLMFACMSAATTSKGNPWIPLASGIILFYFIEYVIHRFVLHGILCKVMPKAHEGHVAHHDHPVDMKYLLTPNAYNIPSYLLMFGVIAAFTRHIHLTALMMTTLVAAQLYYEWIHFVSHRPIIPRTAWGKWMKKYHLLHHFKDEHAYYGVTNPTLDMLMHTNKSHGDIKSKDSVTA